MQLYKAIQKCVFLGVVLFLAAFAFVSFTPVTANAQYYRQVVSKRCGQCGGSVSISSKVGDRCPHCGVIWGREISKTTTTTTTQRARNSSIARASVPTPLTFSFVIGRYSSGYMHEYMRGMYEDKASSTYGIEVGIGPDKQYDYFIMLRYRHYTKESLYSSRYDWSQYFLEIGCRYNGSKPLFWLVYPALGGGVGFTKIHLSKTEAGKPYGFGIYAEAGLELRLTKLLSVVGTAEYTTYRLMYHDDYTDEIEHIGNDGDLFLRAACVFSFNRGGK